MEIPVSLNNFFLCCMKWPEPHKCFNSRGECIFGSYSIPSNSQPLSSREFPDFAELCARFRSISQLTWKTWVSPQWSLQVVHRLTILQTNKLSWSETLHFGISGSSHNLAQSASLLKVHSAPSFALWLRKWTVWASVVFRTAATAKLISFSIKPPKQSHGLIRK